MSRAYDALRAGDALRIDGTGYVAVGRLVLRSPDGSHWSEWLLVPADSTPAFALKEGTHRWLSKDEDGVSEWLPEPVPPELQPQSLSHGDSALIAGMRYRVVERDSARVDSVQGDVGGEANIGAAFDYAELRSGQRRVSLEWDARGAAMTRGRKIGEHDLIAWSRAAGGVLAQRAINAPMPGRALSAARTGSVSGSTSGTVSSGSSNNVVSITIFSVIAALMLVLGSCDDDCYTRTNPVTGQQERVCDDDGIRSRSGGRSYGGWNGK